MDILQRLIDIDKEVMLFLNGSESLYMDGVMKIYTNTVVWFPLVLVLLFVFIKNNSWKNTLLIVSTIALTVVVSDYVSSSLIKPIVARLRPCYDPSILHLIDTFNGYRSGSFSFTSSHACNSFSIFMLLALLIKNRAFSISVFCWALLNSLTRIYLGVHFPGDILCGMLLGIAVGGFMYWLYSMVHKRIEQPSHRITDNYTRSGYLVEDVDLMLSALFSTFVFITIYAIIFINNTFL